MLALLYHKFILYSMVTSSCTQWHCQFSPIIILSTRMHVLVPGGAVCVQTDWRLAWKVDFILWLWQRQSAFLVDFVRGMGNLNQFVWFVEKRCNFCAWVASLKHLPIKYWYPLTVSNNTYVYKKCVSWNIYILCKMKSRWILCLTCWSHGLGNNIFKTSRNKSMYSHGRAGSIIYRYIHI